MKATNEHIFWFCSILFFEFYLCEIKKTHHAGNPDILICGNCREMFTELNDLLDHKRSYCKLRFTCKCQDQLPTIINSKIFI
jgi:uncharacterized CHY-type Zn-finger protein